MSKRKDGLLLALYRYVLFWCILVYPRHFIFILQLNQQLRFVNRRIKVVVRFRWASDSRLNVTRLFWTRNLNSTITMPIHFASLHYRNRQGWSPVTLKLLVLLPSLDFPLKATTTTTDLSYKTPTSHPITFSGLCLGPW